jgi:hypothetical protein
VWSSAGRLSDPLDQTWPATASIQRASSDHAPGPPASTWCSPGDVHDVSMWPRLPRLTADRDARSRSLLGNGPARWAARRQAGPGSALSADAEQTERAGGVTSGPAYPAGDVALPGQPEQADRQVAQAGHHLGAMAAADLRAVLVERHVPHPMQTVLDRPLPRTRKARRAGPARAASRLVMP